MDYFAPLSTIDPDAPINLTRRELLAVLVPLAAELASTPLEEGAVVVRGHRPLVVRMTYDAFLHSDLAAFGELLLDHHLPDSTVLCAYRTRPLPLGPVALAPGTARPREVVGA